MSAGNWHPDLLVGPEIEGDEREALVRWYEERSALHQRIERAVWVECGLFLLLMAIGLLLALWGAR